ncbi:MAG: hypothetical protein IJI66_10200 [Erysipelotrichaceae bacterium]|nr:hypothetical protein [Erysipelotrichaceae bacterium]
MPRAKKDAKKATIYLSNEVINKLEEYCEETGLSKTVAVERFISKCIDDLQQEKKRKN